MVKAFQAAAFFVFRPNSIAETRIQMRHTTSVLMLTLWLLGGQTAIAVVYQIEPSLFNFGGEPEHQLTSGYIQTDGSIGQLTSSSILDYELHVEGLYPFSFRASDPTASLHQLGDLVATPTHIVIPAIQASNGRNELIFQASDNSSPDCTSCTQSLAWYQVRTFQVNQSSSQFIFRDTADLDPDVEPFWFFDFGIDLTVATAVPEPANWLASPLLCCVLVATRRSLYRS